MICFSFAGGGFHKLMLGAMGVDMLVLVPGIQATPLMFVLLEMIMRSHQDAVIQLQGLHLMALLTDPSRCTALVAAGAKGAAAPEVCAAAPGANTVAALARAAVKLVEAAEPGSSHAPLLEAFVTSSKTCLHLMSLLNEPGTCSGLPAIAVRAVAARAAATAAKAARAVAAATTAAAVAIDERIAVAEAALKAASSDTAAAAGGGRIPEGPAITRPTAATPGKALPAGAAMPWASLLPLLGAMITSSKSVWLPNWGKGIFNVVVTKQLQLSSQVLKLADGCIQQHKQLVGGPTCGKRSSTSCQGLLPLEPPALQHVGALVWAAMYAARRAYLPLTAVEQLMTSRVVASGYWEQVVAAASSAAPRGLAVSEVLAVFMKEPESEAEQKGVGTAAKAAGAEGAAGNGVLGAEGGTGAGKESKEQAPSLSDASGASSGTAASRAAAAATVPGCCGSSPSASGGVTTDDDLIEVRDTTNPKHPAAAAADAFGCKQQAGGSGGEADEAFHDSALAVLGVMREFGIVGLYTLTDHMEYAAPLGSDSNVTGQSSLASFSAVSAPSAASSITGALIGVASALRAVCTSGPQLFSNSYSTLSEQLFTGSAAYRQCAIARVLACHGVAFCCNNTACSKLQGFTELQLPVQDGSRRKGVCAGCMAACYCSKQCQKLAWPVHKLTCGVGCKRPESGA